MKNLQKLSDKYKKYSNGLGHIRWGGKKYYEINSDKSVNLNRTHNDWIKNEKGEIELYEFIDAPYVFYLKDKEITHEEYHKIADDLDMHYGEDSYIKEAEIGLEMRHENTRKWYGNSLNNYYPHPWYPDKKIVAIEMIGDIPFTDSGAIHEVFNMNYEDDWRGIIRIPTMSGNIDYSIDECLEYPEFFKPIYKDE